MKKIVASTLATLALMAGGAVQAQTQAQASVAATASATPASTAAARELFDAMNYRVMMNGMMQQMAQNIGNSMRGGAEAAIRNNPKASEQDKQAAIIKMEAELPVAIKPIQDMLSDPGLVDDVLAETVPLYARTYTAEELKQITAFYRSPVGAKMLASMPKLMTEGMQIGQQVVMRRIGPIMQKMQESKQAKEVAK